MICATPPAVDPTDHVRLVFYVCHRIRYPHGMAREDLVAEGLLALVRAARSFDPTRGVRFSSYAVAAIQYALWQLMDRHQQEALPTLSEIDYLVPVEPADALRRGEQHVPSVSLRCLPARLRRVVELRFGLRDGQERSAAEVGREMAISTSRVQQLLRNALARLRREKPARFLRGA